jgi:glutaminyl-peptide cyclotransferase
MKLSTKSPDAPERGGLPPHIASDVLHQHGAEILRLVEEQVSLGPRVPGSAAHERLALMLEERVRSYAHEVTLQDFPVKFRGSTLHCRTIVGVFRSALPAGKGPPLLLGTHYDTRLRADREGDPARRERPIPGANDGGSGTAVLLHLLPWLAGRDHGRDIGVAFFDAEDLGNIDGKEFSLGAAWCAAHPVEGLTPAEVVVLDMVGGRDMVLDIDAGILSHLPSRRLTAEIFRIGSEQEWQPFTRDKLHRVKHIISDHYPFACQGTASCILIDMDYPQWHTLQDTPEALSAESLGITEAALQLFLSRPQG